MSATGFLLITVLAAGSALAFQGTPAAPAGPGEAKAAFERGIALYSGSRPQEAVAPLRQALKLDPSLIEARNVLAASLAESGQCKEALPAIKKALPRVSDKTFKRALGVDAVRCAMSLNQMDDAVESIRSLNREFPRDPEILYLTVHVFSDLSIRASQDLLFSAPSSYQVHQLNAEALETQGKWDDAAIEYRNVLAQNPRLPGIHFRLGRLLLSQPKSASTLEQAEREFKAELEVNPANAGAEYVLGEIDRQNHNFAEAAQHFGRATAFDANFADAFIGQGRSLVSAGKAAEALAPLQTAVKLQPANPVAHFHLAVVYRRLGRKDDADREAALHKQTSERARQTSQEIQTGILGPQRADPGDTQD